jgi:methionine aminopeptidase
MRRLSSVSHITDSDLGAQLDGFVGVCATTIVVGASKENPVTGPKADAIAAAYTAAQAALRLLTPGKHASDVGKVIDKATKEFGCTPVEGMISYSLGRNQIAGEKTIIQNPSDQQRKDHKDSDIALNDVFAIDVLVSTGEGKARQAEARTSIYKRTGATYMLKMATSRKFLSDAQTKFGMMPFSLRCVFASAQCVFCVRITVSSWSRLRQFLRGREQGPHWRCRVCQPQCHGAFPRVHGQGR